ncbi:MAG: DMT family transporter [Pseudomonadota bacterium]
MPLAVLPEFVLLAALWGSSFLFAQLAVPEFGPVPTAFMRCAIGALVVLPLVLARGHDAARRRQWRAAGLVGVLNTGVPFALFAFALQSITTSLSAILNATAPMFGALVAWVWLKDRPGASRVLGLVIGFAGVAALASDKGSFALPGASATGTTWAVLACLLACLCYGISASAAKRHLQGIPPLVTAVGGNFGATLALVLPALWLAPARMPTLSAWLMVILLGAACTGLAYVLYFRLIERIGPARALSVTFLIPVFAVIYGAIFLGERVTGWMVLCGAVIVLGTALATGLLTLPRRVRASR